MTLLLAWHWLKDDSWQHVDHRRKTPGLLNNSQTLTFTYSHMSVRVARPARCKTA